MKLFRTTDTQVVVECQAYFGLICRVFSLLGSVLNFWTDSRCTSFGG